MKKAVIIVIVVATCLSLLTACTTNSTDFPEDVALFCSKHDLSCFSPEEAHKNCKVGESCVVLGTVTYIYYADYFKGSSLLNEVDDTVPGLKSYMEGTMYYSITLDKYSECKIVYDGYDYQSSRFNINVGDTVAFLVTCEDSGYSKPSYRYAIEKMIWSERHSDKTVEDEFYEKEKGN